VKTFLQLIGFYSNFAPHFAKSCFVAPQFCIKKFFKNSLAIKKCRLQAHRFA
jgi:hypothetical protein